MPADQSAVLDYELPGYTSGARVMDDLSSGFEWDEPAPWVPYLDPGWEGTSVEYAVGRNGTRALQFDGAASTGFMRTQWVDLDVLPGDTIEMSFWVKKDAAYNGTDSKLRLANADTNALITAVNYRAVDIANTTAWHQKSATATVPAGCTVVRLYFQSTGHTAGKVWVDDVVVQHKRVDALSSLTLAEQCELIWEETLKQEQAEERLRRQKPIVLIFDGDWNLQYELAQEYDAQFSWISNDSGPGKTTIPFNTEVAQWIHDWQGRIDRGEKRNVHITVDYCGARWSGRLDQANVKLTTEGDKALEVTWLHDYENLKWYSVWSNPFFPAAFQAPRVFILAGPVPWVLKMSLFLNILREHNPLITIPDDPLDLGSWFSSLDQSQWNVVVKPGGFLENMASGAIWGMVSSRWSNWHDMAKQMLEDAEYSVTCRRWFEGDPIPDGFQASAMTSGQLVVDIEDKSGVYIGTSNGGSLFDGIARTFFEFADDFIDSTEEVVADNTIPNDYFRWGHKYTDKRLPYVIYEEGMDSGIQSSEFIVSPAKGIQVNVGGHSMPGINESISATIQAAGDILGNIAQIGGLGGTIDSLVKPLYEDTILAWWSVKSIARAQNSGWGRYFEYFQEGASKAYTIASLMVLRAGFWATKTTISAKVSVIDGAPFTVGDSGLGHFFLDDRIGIVLKDDIRRKIHMDRCRKIDLAWDPENPPEWQLTIGDDRALQDPAQRAWGKIESIVAALRELGVY